MNIWEHIDEETKSRIIKETQEAIDRGHAGMNCDVNEWQKLLDFAMEKIK
jgi:hypothetical protein